MEFLYIAFAIKIELGIEKRRSHDRWIFEKKILRFYLSELQFQNRNLLELIGIKFESNLWEFDDVPIIKNI